MRHGLSVLCLVAPSRTAGTKQIVVVVAAIVWQDVYVVGREEEEIEGVTGTTTWIEKVGDDEGMTMLGVDGGTTMLGDGTRMKVDGTKTPGDTRTRMRSRARPSTCRAMSPGFASPWPAAASARTCRWEAVAASSCCATVMEERGRGMKKKKKERDEEEGWREREKKEEGWMGRAKRKGARIEYEWKARGREKPFEVFTSKI